MKEAMKEDTNHSEEHHHKSNNVNEIKKNGFVFARV